jgi:hypothetical protein
MQVSEAPSEDVTLEASSSVLDVDSDEEVDSGDVFVVVNPGPPTEDAQPKPRSNFIAKEKTTAPNMQEYEKVGLTSTPVCVTVNAQYVVHYSRKTPPSQHLLPLQQPQPRPNHPNHRSHKLIRSLARAPCPSSSVTSPPVRISLPFRLALATSFQPLSQILPHSTLPYRTLAPQPAESGTCAPEASCAKEKEKVLELEEEGGAVMMSEEERRDLRRAKRDRAMGYDD